MRGKVAQESGSPTVTRDVILGVASELDAFRSEQALAERVPDEKAN